MRRWLITFLIGLAACASPVPVAPTDEPVPAGTATVAPDDLAPYRAAMRPEFAGDVDRFAQATRYRIELTVSADLTTITGQQQVRYTNTESAPLDAVYFRLFANAESYGGRQQITALRVNGVDVKPALELKDTALKIKMNPPLPPGDAAEFEMEYTVAVPDATVKAGYNQLGLHDGVLTLPNVYPIIPVYDDEGWSVGLAPGYGDAVYSDTALYRVTITAPSDQIVAASGVCDVADAGSNRVWRCASGPMRDFMIAMSADYVVASEPVDGITINSYALNQDVKAGQRALEYTVEAVASYQPRIGPYPFTELDVLETPTTAGGIEYPGLIIVAARLYDDAPTQEFVTAHEVAHQWWYSLVGNNQVDEPWIDEALTQYTSILYFRDRYGDDPAALLVGEVFQSRYKQALSDGADLRADLPVASYSVSQYGEIVYGKAPLFFDALYQAMGDAKFNAFLQTYFEAHRYGIATAQDLLDAAATQIDRKTIDQLLKTWITTPDP